MATLERVLGHSVYIVAYHSFEEHCVTSSQFDPSAIA